MAAQLNTAPWAKTQTLDRQTTVLQKILDIPSKTNTLQHRKNDYTTVISDIPSKNSFLYSQKLKQSLLESKKAFLNLSLEDSKQEECQLEEKSLVLTSGEQRRPFKKISFKIKKTSSIYRRSHQNQTKMTTISANTVAELTKKFEMGSEGLAEPQLKKILKRVNSQRNSDKENDKKVTRKASFKTKDLKVARKPSVKTKSADDKNLVIIRKPLVVRKNSEKSTSRTNSENKGCVRAKIGYLEGPLSVPKPEAKPPRPNSLPLTKTNILTSQISPTSGTVRATIEIFERKTSLTAPTLKELPKDTTSTQVSNKPVTNVVTPVSNNLDSVNHSKQEATKVDTVQELQPNKQDKEKEDTKVEELQEPKRPLPTKNYSTLHNSSSLNTQREVPKILPKPKLPEKKYFLRPKTILKDTHRQESDLPKEQAIKTDIIDEVQIINIPAVLPKKRCDSLYETTHLKKVSPPTIKRSKSEKIEPVVEAKNEQIVPNTSFLWRTSQDRSPSLHYKSISVDSTLKSDSVEGDDWELVYETSDVKACELKQPPTSKPPEITIDLVPEIPPRPVSTGKPPPPPPTSPKPKMPLPDEKIYEELRTGREIYEYCQHPDYEDVDTKTTTDDGYEYCASPTVENIYEILPTPQATPPKVHRTSLIQQEPLPPTPLSYTQSQIGEDISNCYESIYNPESLICPQLKKDADSESNYESIYGCQIINNGQPNSERDKDFIYNVSTNGSNGGSTGSNRDSLISEQQTNSLYGRSLTNFCLDSVYNGKANSDLSVSDRSDDWVDVTDNEDENKASGIIIVRGKQKSKKSGWREHCREQWSKTPRKLSPDHGVDSDSDHHYETLYTNQNGADDYDTDFESDTESENSFGRVNLNDSGLDIANNQLPDPPNGGQYVFTRLAASAGKHMKKLRRNWSLTKNDISKSLSRMTKRKSRTDLTTIENPSKDDNKDERPQYSSANTTISSSNDVSVSPTSHNNNSTYQNVDATDKTDTSEKTKSLGRKGFLNKFRRSMSMTSETASELTSNLNKPKSTFYLTETIDVDDIEKAEEAQPDSGVSLSPVPITRSKPNVVRPQSPPPPVPPLRNPEKKLENNDRKASSWYAEAGLFRNESHKNTARRSNTFWYAEVGLYQTSNSTPSTSSAENSGNNIIVNAKNPNNKSVEILNAENTKNKLYESRNSLSKDEEYYNIKNDSQYYNSSVSSFSSNETKKDESSLNQDLHAQLQDEPLYQFYDAAVLESVCTEGTSDFDSDGYEEVGSKRSNSSSSSRPSAMELINPTRNSMAFTRTLWCEIPEVINSSVLSTLSSHQKRLQEAKFEMLTSEASYLNSLSLLNDHFIRSFMSCNLVSDEDKETLFGKISAVKECSEKLLHDLEKCWQDNILLQGVCDIVQKHAEENFYVYVTYCANQISIDETLKKLKEVPGFEEKLKQLETSTTCHSLTLYSFLMLPMQRITRWPLLVDAVLKRLSQQDPEYLTCQYSLATLNKIVNQCNEAARTKEREIEMKKISGQLEFAKGVKPISIVDPNRWLIRSGVVTHMMARTDETKLTFGKRFNKVPLHLFLFNDMLFVTKLKNDNTYSVIQYCQRNLVELSTSDIISLPVKDTHGRHLLFLTLLENQDEKTVEFMLSCSSESDKERWVEALSPLKSENPDETLYECWDCPQVTVIHNYVASQPDELPVVRGDVINVLRKMADGWYHGERIRDGQTGWFPANYTVEIANPHVRARNLKQRYRLLAFSENYLKSN